MAVIVAEALPGFTFGADPEFFLRDMDTGAFIPASDYLEGTKEEPYKCNGGAYQVDGVAAEFNIDPVTDFDTFNGNINKVLKEIRKRVPNNVEFVFSSSAEFSKKSWDKVPEHDKILGCSPDYNAWTGDMNPPPNVSESSRVRCAGGHLHIGWTNDALMSDENHILNCRELVQQLDWYLGAWSLNHDTGVIRRTQYGKAGACRIKPYGVEYRVLSNFWLQSTAMRRETWNRMIKAINTMRTDFKPDHFQFNDKVIQSINSSTLDSTLVSNFPSPILFS